MTCGPALPKMAITRVLGREHVGVNWAIYRISNPKAHGMRRFFSANAASKWDGHPWEQDELKWGMSQPTC
jgi:hypothetical protein